MAYKNVSVNVAHSIKGKWRMKQIWQAIKKRFRAFVDALENGPGGDRYGCVFPDRPRFFLGWFIKKLLPKQRIPESSQERIKELQKSGIVVYALKYRSHFDLLFVTHALESLSLPLPRVIFDMKLYPWLPGWHSLKLFFTHIYHLIRYHHLPNPYQTDYYCKKLLEYRKGLIFLVGEKGYYERSLKTRTHDPLLRLLETQARTETPIHIVPVVLFYGKGPRRQQKSLIDVFFGDQENPGFFRKIVSLFRNRKHTLIELANPLNLQDVLANVPENVATKVDLAFNLRQKLIEDIDLHRKAILGPIFRSKLELKEIILRHPRLERYMQRVSKSRNLDMWKVRKMADGYLEEIAAEYSISLILLSYSVLSWMWDNIFDGIEVDMESLERVKATAKEKTLVYVPCHKSHIDYLILSYVLFENNLSTPLVAAGKNLAFWPVGPIFRKCGAFFIRRTFKGAKFYSEVFSMYVKVLVQLGHNIEFFIEGGRSRTGKLVLPKLGLLAILIQAIEEGFCDDLAFVPVSISYDRIIEEEAYLKEISGGTKEAENVGQLVRARRFLKKRYGRVYVHFAEPMSFKKYIESQNYRLGEMPSKERHAMYRDFAYRIISSINRVSLVTPFALVSAAFLTKPSRGILRSQFWKIVQIYYDYLNITGVRMSNTLANLERAVVDTLTHLEKSKLIEKLKVDDELEDDPVYTIEDNKRLHLEYYKNNIIHFLLPASYVATSILTRKSFTVSSQDIYDDFLFFRDLFKYEFVFDADHPVNYQIRENLEAFAMLGFMKIQNQATGTYRLSSKGLYGISCFASLIREYFESYWIVLRSIRYLKKKPYSEKEFLKKINSLGQKLFKLELIQRYEAISKLNFQNALKYYTEKKLIRKFTPDDKKDSEEHYRPTDNDELYEYYANQFDRFLKLNHNANH